MRCHLIIVSLIHLSVSLFAKEPDSIKYVPPGYAYRVLPKAYEGKTVAELGDIKSIELIDNKISASSHRIAVTNDTIKQKIFEFRLAHPASTPMIDIYYDNTVVVTFVDGTVLRSSSSGFSTITLPDKTNLQCMLLLESSYIHNRKAFAINKDGESGPRE